MANDSFEGEPDYFDLLLLGKDDPEDERNFDTYKLDDLRCVLIEEDDYSEKVTCYLVVGAGHHDVPSEFPGLAHFTEHLFASHSLDDCGEAGIFSPKYTPCSAVTYGDYTIYTSEGVTDNQDNDAIPELKKFLGLFACNNFSVDLMKKHALSLTQEYETHRGHGNIRIEETTRLFHTQGKPISRGFHWGNIASLSQSVRGDDGKIREILSGQRELSDEDLTQLQQAVKEFTEEHYKVTNCVLMLRGADMERMTTISEEISDVIMNMPVGKDDECTPPKPNKDEQSSSPGPGSMGDDRKRKQNCNSPGKKTEASQAPIPTKRAKRIPKEILFGPPYVNEHFNKIYYVQPPECDDQIVLSWVVPYTNEKQFSKVKPLLYISALLKGFPEGSPITMLTAQGLITDMNINTGGFCSEEVQLQSVNIPWSRRYKAHLFSILFRVTRTGARKFRIIIAAVLWYLNLIKPDPKTYEAIRVAREMKIKLFGTSRGKEQTDHKVACAVLYPEAHNENALTDDIRLFEYNEKEIQDVLDILKSPKNMNVMIMANLGADLETEFPNREELRAWDGQPMGFKYGVRDFSNEELQTWFRFPDAKKMHEPLKRLRMPTANDLGILDGDPEWKKVKENLYKGVSTGQRREKNVPRTGNTRVLMIRKARHDLPHANINVQFRPPEHVLSPKLRAYMEIFDTMIRFRARLKLTWLQQQCVRFETSELKDTGEMEVWIQGLAHLAAPLLTSVLSWIHTPSLGFTGYRDAILEATRKSILDRIHEYEKFTDDLFFRRALVGYMPYIECYNHVVEAAQGELLYDNLEDLFKGIEFIALARTNVDNLLGGAENEIVRIPQFELNPPPDVEAPPGSRYEWSNFEDPGRHPKQSTMRIKNPNRGSHISCVRHYYLLHREAWNGNEDDWKKALNKIYVKTQTAVMQYIVNELSFAYETAPSAALDYIESQPLLKITLPTDSKRTTCDIINRRIEETLRKAIDYISADETVGTSSVDIEGVKQVFTKLFFGKGEENPRSYPWRYIIQIEGASDSDRALATEGSNLIAGAIDYATYDPEGQNCREYARAQLRERDANPKKAPTVRRKEKSIFDKTPPPMF